VVLVIFTGSAYDVIDVNEYFHDFMFHDLMFVNRAPPRFGKFSSTDGAKPWKVSIGLLHYSSTIRGLFVLIADYSYYSSTIRTIRRLFVLFFAYSRTIRTIRWLFADYSYYSSTIRTIRTIRFTILVLSIAGFVSKARVSACMYFLVFLWFLCVWECFAK
jgi:hypothetical protein